MPSPKPILSELQMLRKEIEAMGEVFDRERLVLRSEIDKLKLETEAIRSTLRRLVPEFASTYDKTYPEKLRSFDPEIGKNAGHS